MARPRLNPPKIVEPCCQQAREPYWVPSGEPDVIQPMCRDCYEKWVVWEMRQHFPPRVKDCFGNTEIHLRFRRTSPVLMRLA